MDDPEALAAFVIMLGMLVLRRQQATRGAGRRRVQQPRRYWTSPLCITRPTEGCMNVTVPRLHHFNRAPGSFYNFFRLDRELFELLLTKVSPRITRADTNMRQSVSARDRLAVTLRFLATGNSMTDLHYHFRMGISTISDIIPETCDAIYSALKDDYLRIPSTPQEWLAVAKEFNELWNFPNCLGAIDGKHIVMRKPHHAGSMYHNYKGQESIVLMAIVDAQQKFLFIDVGSNGRVSDGGVWRDCSLNHALERGVAGIPNPAPLSEGASPTPFALVGDEAFALKKYLMKPYARRTLDHDKRVFNYRLSRARRIVENAFGRLAGIWQVFRTYINLSPDKVDKVVLACCALQNYVLQHRTLAYTTDTDAYIADGTWRNQPRRGMRNLQLLAGRNVPQDAKLIRDGYREYFNGIGAVEWQERMISYDPIQDLQEDGAE